MTSFGHPLSSWWFCYWSLIIAVVAMDVTKTYIFRDFRKGVAKASIPLGNLLKCAYCLSHWLALAVCLYHHLNILWSFVLVGFAVVPMVLIALLILLLERPELKEPEK